MTFTYRERDVVGMAASLDDEHAELQSMHAAAGAQPGTAGCGPHRGLARERGYRRQPGDRLRPRLRGGPQPLPARASYRAVRSATTGRRRRAYMTLAL